MFLGFIVGFVCVLCIGNFYRAKKASERQKQRRLARFSTVGGNGIVDSPKSSTTSGSTDLDTERQHLLAHSNPGVNRRRPVDNTDTESLLFQVDDGQAANLLWV